jgi:hypothetical protein
MLRRLAGTFLCLGFVLPSVSAQSDPPKEPPSEAPAAKVQATEPPSGPVPERLSDEDWTTLDLAKSRLPLKEIGGVALSKAELPGCTRELLQFHWRPNDPIDLYVIRPRVTRNPPVVLFMYNYILDEAIFREDRWCNLVQKNGYAAVGLTSALSWSRLRSPRPMQQWFVSQLQEALATSTHDVQMVLNYLETRGDLDTQHVGMFGQGSGGAVAILAAAADSRIHVLDLMDPWGDWPDWLKGSKQIPEDERPKYLKPEFLAGVAGLDPVSYLPQLKDRAIHIQQLLSDPVTPPAAKEKIAAAVPQPDEIMRYPDGKEEAKALGKDGLVSWFAEQLHSQKPAPSDAH